MILLSMLAAAVAAQATPVKRPECPERDGVHEVRAIPRAEAQPLIEMPPANHVLTVYREVDRCPAPVIVRYGIGGPGGR